MPASSLLTAGSFGRKSRPSSTYVQTLSLFQESARELETLVPSFTAYKFVFRAQEGL